MCVAIWITAIIVISPLNKRHKSILYHAWTISHSAKFFVQYHIHHTRLQQQQKRTANHTQWKDTCSSSLASSFLLQARSIADTVIDGFFGRAINTKFSFLKYRWIEAHIEHVSFQWLSASFSCYFQQQKHKINISFLYFLFRA